MTYRRQLPLLNLFAAAALIAIVFVFASSAAADPLFGRDLLKFSQSPMVTTPVNGPNGVPQTYYGHDELSTAYSFPNSTTPNLSYQGRFMADDFADKLGSPIVHVKWWGSYQNDVINPAMPVDKFLISFESDVPGGTGANFSRPGDPLLNQVVKRGALAPGSGTFTEKLIRGPDPILGESLYEYNAELHLGKAFPEQRDKVYWLKIAAMVDVPGGITFPPNQPPTFATRWGWHNRDYTVPDALASTPPAVVPGEHIDGILNGTPVWHFQDDAVTGVVRIEPTATGGLVMPFIVQPVAQMAPTHYIDGVDGPGSPIAGGIGISSFSKDLAFELYTTRVIPEPATSLLAMLGLAAAASVRRRATAA